VNARYEEIPLTVEEYMLLRLRHKPNKDACPKCDGLGSRVRSIEGEENPYRPVVPCSCRTIGPRKFLVLKGCTPGNLELFPGDVVEVYGWPHTGGRLRFNITGPGSLCDGGWPSNFRNMLKEGYFRFIDVNSSDVPRAAGASTPAVVDADYPQTPPQC
jgi:hypothetical protein